MSKTNHESLGENVIPEKYDIELAIDMKNWVFNGKEIIDAYVKKPTKEILLNSNELEIQNTEVETKSESLKATVAYDRKKERISIKTGKKVNGKCKISIEFKGIIKDSLNGLYRSAYYLNGEKKYIVTTQFEAPDARRAFPCFDEPEFKAVFQIALLIDKSLEAISNMPIKEIREEGEKKRVVFEPTPKMSTYLVYIGVGDFDYVEGRLRDLKIRVATVKGKKEMARIPLQYAIKFVDFYEKYFGIKYPLKKLDLIAIPDFAAGAMENWGAITFREIDLLCKEDTPLENKQGVAITIAHELAHQWFGDLVTMKWWNDLWLNESFATFMSYKAVDHVFPEWKMQSHYLKDTVGVAMSEDSMKSTHPISVKVNTPGEISGIFDAISYEKGGSVLNMLEDYVTPELFRKGLHEYLKEHAFSNTEAKDLWQAIAKASKKTKLKEVAKAWIEKPGFPEVLADFENSTIKIRQRRFTISGDMAATWPLPIHYLYAGKEARTLLETKEMRIEKASDDSFLKLNYGQKGLYISVYDEPLLEKVFEAVKARKLSGIDTWGVEQDLFMLTRSARIPLQKYLDAIQNYFLAAEYPANEGIIGHLIWLHTMPYGSNQFEKVRQVMEKFANKIMANLGFEARPSDTPIDKSLRSNALLCLGLSGNVHAVEFAKKQFEKELSGRQIDKDLKSKIYELAAWYGDGRTFEKMKNKYINIKEAEPDESIRLLRALAFFRDKELVRKAFGLAVSKYVRLQDKYVIPAYSTYNPESFRFLVEWTFTNWQKLKQQYPEGTMMLSRFVANLSMLKSKKDLERVSAFFSKKENLRDDIKMEVKKTIERIKANIAFAKANGI